MDKLDGKSMDLVNYNIEKLKELFPEVVTEGKVDFNSLQSILGENIETRDERYEFTWNGKSDSIKLANKPSTGTLRPDKTSSKNWHTTGNLYIEGDNLEVLKLLQKSYFNKIKMIYIDPPYNTGNDFVYMDNFRDNIQNYKEITSQTAKSNAETSGRYHTDWLNMMYPRLRLARNLLREDGVIFISIDDNEVHNLRKVCDEVFGEENFVACVIWERAYSPVNLKKYFSENHDYALCYAKNIELLVCNGLKRSDDSNNRYKNPDKDPRGLWKSCDLSVGPAVIEKLYKITTPSGRMVTPPEGRCWLFTKDRYDEMVLDNRIWFGENGNNVPSLKKFLSEVKDVITPMTIWKYLDVGHSQDAKQKLKELFDGLSIFDYPKSVNLIKRMLQLFTENNSLVLDFFSGSSTTAHAVMQLNAEDGGNRKFIMVQLPELCNEDSEAYKAGYKNICEIGKERIRRAGEKIKEENKDKEGIENFDIGFKVFKLDNSNIKEWDVDKEDLEITLQNLINSVKEDRKPIDILYEVLIKLGLDLNSLVEEKEILNKMIFSVGMGYLIASFDENIGLDLIDEIGKMKPEIAVFLDRTFENDVVKTNAYQRFKKYGVKEIKSI